MMTKRSVVLLFAGSLCALAQSAAPSDRCDFDGARFIAEVRQIAGGSTAPYQFACGVREEGKCLSGSLPAGLVVSVDRLKNGWACVTGGDSSSGWVPASQLEAVPTEPKLPLSKWIGWWHNGPSVKGVEEDILLLTQGKEPGSIQVSGKAFWYGAILPSGQVVHTGQVTGTAVPMGKHLHLIENDGPGGCVLDLTLDISAPVAVMAGYDNQRCGGMNVNFRGKWVRFIPDARKESVR